MSAINDPLGQTHNPASSDQMKLVLFYEILKSGGGCTDTMCEYNDHLSAGAWWVKNYVKGYIVSIYTCSILAKKTFRKLTYFEPIFVILSGAEFCSFFLFLDELDNLLDLVHAILLEIRVDITSDL